MRRNLARERQEVMDWYGKMLACVETLPADERAVFDKWDAQRTGDVGASDWPGFEKYLPPRPWTQTRARNEERV